MSDQPIITVIGIAEVGIRVINQLVRHEAHYIGNCIAIASDAATVYDAQIPTRLIAPPAPFAIGIVPHLQASTGVFLVVDSSNVPDIQLAQQITREAQQLKIPIIVLVTNINSLQKETIHTQSFQQLQHIATGIFMLDHQQPERIKSVSQRYTPPEAILHASTVLSGLLQLVLDPGLIAIELSDINCFFCVPTKIGIIKTYQARGENISQQIITAIQQSNLVHGQYAHMMLNVRCGESITLTDIGTIAESFVPLVTDHGHITWGLIIDVNCPEDYLQIDLFAIESI